MLEKIIEIVKDQLGLEAVQLDTLILNHSGIVPLDGIDIVMRIEEIFKVDIPEEDAIKMYTVNAAYAGFEENVKGTIEPGKLADLVVLSLNPLEVELEQLKDIEVEMTILGGKITYSINR